MKCSICDKEVYYQESKWLFILNLFVILVMYNIKFYFVVFIMAICNLGLSWIYNSQRVKHDAVHAKDNKNLEANNEKSKN